MAQAPIAASTGSSASEGKNYIVPLIILTSLFFMWGFLTVLNDVLIPYLKNVFELNYTQALLIQFCFFAAYGVCSIPAGIIVKKLGYQYGIVVGLTIAAVGCFMFILAANALVYPIFLGALFVLAAGITLLQQQAGIRQQRLVVRQFLAVDVLIEKPIGKAFTAAHFCESTTQICIAVRNFIFAVRLPHLLH